MAAPDNSEAAYVFSTFLLRQLESPDLTLIRAAAVPLLPEEHNVDKPVRPVSYPFQVPPPRVGGKCLVGPSVLAEGAGDKDITDLIKCDPELMPVMP